MIERPKCKSQPLGPVQQGQRGALGGGPVGRPGLSAAGGRRELGCGASRRQGALGVGDQNPDPFSVSLKRSAGQAAPALFLPWTWCPWGPGLLFSWHRPPLLALSLSSPSWSSDLMCLKPLPSPPRPCLWPSPGDPLQEDRTTTRRLTSCRPFVGWGGAWALEGRGLGEKGEPKQEGESGLEGRGSQPCCTAGGIRSEWTG